ncbi:MAG TPA: glycerate kinase [Burkholderiales bacterium]|nr:glycerate kinase [Burkholderiales bacterium]
MPSIPPRKLLLGSFKAALAAADPLQIVPRHLPKPPEGRTLAVGAGKAAASMAYAVEKHWPKNNSLSGVVITRYGHSLPTRQIKVIEAGHPIPDASGETAAKQILEEAKKLGPDDLLLALISGGGSSLLSLPVAGISMADLKAVTRQLLLCGATIQEINTVRKHLSAIQGGRLAAACKAPVVALIISDVTGDNPTHIASGPCTADPTTYGDALRIISRYQVKAPEAIMDILHRGHEGRLEETPKPNNTAFRKVENRVIATAHNSLLAAAKYLRKQGIKTAVLGDTITGEAREVAKVFGGLARQILKYGEPWKRGVALISGGETTVTVRGNGRGGRNTEFLLSLAIDLDGMKNVYALSCGTDGSDGTGDNAGALIAPDTLQRARKLDLNPERLLTNNDSYSFFQPLGDLVMTGATRTNVNDFRVLIVR